MLNGLKFSQTCSHNIRRSSSGPKNIKNKIQCAKSHAVSGVSCHETRHYVTITPHKRNKVHKHTMAPFFPLSPRKMQQFCSSTTITYSHSGLSLENMARLKDYAIITVFKFNFIYIYIYIYINSHFQFNYNQIPHYIFYNLWFICCVFGTSYSTIREISHVRKYRWPLFMCLRNYLS
jgi:hypothetical protein